MGDLLDHVSLFPALTARCPRFVRRPLHFRPIRCLQHRRPWPRGDPGGLDGVDRRAVGVVAATIHRGGSRARRCDPRPGGYRVLVLFILPAY